MDRQYLLAQMVFLLLATAVLAGNDPLDNAVRSDPSRSLYARMVSSLKLQAEEEKTTGTLFVPSDRAMNAFLSEMGLTADELLARPQLVDAILAYHFAPGVALKDFALKDPKGGRELISTNAQEPSILKTGDVDNDLEIFRSANTGEATLIDAQGNRVAVVGKPTQYGKMIIWDVSKVLLSGQYFYSTRAAIRHYPEWTSFQELYQRGAQSSKALADALAGRSAFTYLLPDNEALKPAMQALSKAGTTDLAQLLEYHVLPAMRPVPTGWKDGEKVKTLLAGQDMTAQLTQSPYTDPYDGSTKQGPELALVPGVGKPSKVVIQNIYAGKSILQGLDAPLVPNTALAKVLGAANNAKTAAEQGPKVADSKSGRKLLQRSRSASRNNNWSAQNTQSAIRAAAAGRTPVSYATAAGSRNAHNANRGCVNCVNWR